MAGKRELTIPGPRPRNKKDQSARKLLRYFWSRGYRYVELRQDGKSLVFFCAVCRTACYSDSILLSHLNGKVHKKRLAAAQATVLKTNPFPFNDGMHFYHNSTGSSGQSPVPKADEVTLLTSDAEDGDRDDLAIVCYSEKETSCPSLHTSCQQDVTTEFGSADTGRISKTDGQDSILVVPDVLQKDEKSDLAVTHIGSGQITARMYEKDDFCDEICRIWCEWVGKEDLVEASTASMQEHAFSVVTFSYKYSLGRKDFLDYLKLLVPPDPNLGSEETVDDGKKRKKSCSDPEDANKSVDDECDSFGEELQSSTNLSPRSLIDLNDDELISSSTPSKRMRKKLRLLKRLAAERACNICQIKMLPGKDVAALLNRNTGRLACSSRNFTGAFHMFHVSCLIHWILLCELEIYSKRSAPTAKRKFRRKAGAKNKGVGKNNEAKIAGTQAHSLFCPECQGTGTRVYGKELERPTVNLSEMYRLKKKIIDGYGAWKASPELVPNSSTGLYFPPQIEDDHQEFISSLKLLRFYRSDDTRTGMRLTR